MLLFSIAFSARADASGEASAFGRTTTMEVPLSPRPSLDTVSTVARRVLQHHLDSPFPFADEDCKAKIPVMTTTSAASATPANTLTGLAVRIIHFLYLFLLFTPVFTSQRVFSNPRAWNVLDEDEKLEILSLIPPIFHPDTSITPIPPLDAEFLLYSTDWSGGVRQFEEDVRAGRYASRFRVQAEKASRDRAAGKLISR